MKRFAILLVFLVASSSLLEATPLPQESKDYGDFDESLARLEEKKDEVIEDNNEGDAIADLFNDIFKGAGALLSEGIKIATNVADGSRNVTDTLGDVVRVGTDATQEAARIGVKAVGAAPQIIEEKVAFAQGLGKTIQDTSGQVRQGVKDFNTQLKVAAAFARTYGEFALENFGKFMETFATRLKCNTDCEKLAKGSAEREQCEKEYCIEVKRTQDPEEIVEEYDYSYGYEDTEANSVKDDEKSR